MLDKQATLQNLAICAFHLAVTVGLFVYFISVFSNIFLGEDPLDGRIDGDDINSVAGLLKLYFRELKEPLFPASVFDQLVECSHKYNINGECGKLSVNLEK
jgi:hypothetical protein